jgi:DNA-binding FadR family transcriptional regulator
MGLLETGIRGTRQGSSHTMVVEALGASIVSGEIAEGAVLPGDQELMLRYGVSRTVLREAMKTLAAKGLVAARSRVGTWVRSRDDWNFLDGSVLGWRLGAGMDAEFVSHLAEMRLALEPAAAALAARHATSDEIVALYGLAARMDDAGHSRESFARADLEFHLAIARMSRNPFMRSVSSLIEAALTVAFQLSSPALTPQGIVSSAAEHLAIVHAIAARDETRVSEAMRKVILTGAGRIRDVLG